MIHEAPIVVPSRVAVIEATTPSPEPPVGETGMPAPTSEQAQTADRILTSTPTHPDPAATLMGVLTSAMLLRDIAVDTFDTSEEDEEKHLDADKKPPRL